MAIKGKTEHVTCKQLSRRVNKKSAADLGGTCQNDSVTKVNAAVGAASGEHPMKSIGNILRATGLIACCASFFSSTAFADDATFEFDPDRNAGRHGHVKGNYMVRMTFANTPGSFSWRSIEGMLDITNANYSGVQRARRSSNNREWFIWVNPVDDSKAITVALKSGNSLGETGSITFNEPPPPEPEPVVDAVEPETPTTEDVIADALSEVLEDTKRLSLEGGIKEEFESFLEYFYTTTTTPLIHWQVYYAHGDRVTQYHVDGQPKPPRPNGGILIREYTTGGVTTRHRVEATDLTEAQQTSIMNAGDTGQEVVIGTGTDAETKHVYAQIQPTYYHYHGWGVWIDNGPNTDYLLGFYMNTCRDGYGPLGNDSKKCTKKKNKHVDRLHFIHRSGENVDWATTNPTGTGSATWTGKTRVINSSPRLHGDSADGDAKVTVTFGDDPAAAVAFTNFTGGLSVDDITGSGISIRSGEFRCQSGTCGGNDRLWELYGRFAGENGEGDDPHEFVGGSYALRGGQGGVFIGLKD